MELEPAVEAPATEPVETRAPAELYRRSFVEQLDLIPPDADGYLVVRDLRPIFAQLGVIEQVMAGPLARAIPALAQLGGGTGEGRLAELERARELLELGLAGVEGAGIELDRGLVVVLGKSSPVVLFAAVDLERLLGLASLFGADLAQSCRSLPEQPGWYACALGGQEALERYTPAKQGAALHDRLSARLGASALARANVALSLADPNRPIHAALRTDPDLWELSLPLPLGEDEAGLLESGPSHALDHLVPGNSFTWARVDPRLLARAGSFADAAEGLEDSFTGEVWFGGLEQPDGLALRLGTRDAEAASRGVEAMAKLLPETPIVPDGFAGLELSFDRAWLELEAGALPSIGVRAQGESASDWAQTLGVATRARLWADAGYLNLAMGEVQALPLHLHKPVREKSAATLADLPSTLARALLAEEVGFAMHLVLDHWQAPLSESELSVLLAGVAGAAKPSSAAIFALFEALAPWSSLSVWLAREPGSAWRMHVSLVPFTAGGSASESQAASEALDRILAGADAQEAYRDLLERFADSRQVGRYQARVGVAPTHQGAVGMTQVALLGALALPAFESYLNQAQRSEAPAQTQSIISAALQARERAGNCKALLGRAGPTPPLEVLCHLGQGGRCRAIADQELDSDLEDAHYPLALWADNPVWSALGYQIKPGTGHQSHYSVDITQNGGQCRIQVDASADLNGDGVYSRYRRVATVAKDGSTTLAPLEIEAPGE